MLNMYLHRYSGDRINDYAEPKQTAFTFIYCNPIFTNLQLALARLYGNTQCVVCSAWRPGILHHGNFPLPLFGLSTYQVII